MNERLVLDAGALSLHFADHPGVRRYFDAIIAGRSVGLVSGVNLAEFYYKTCQKIGKQTADTWYFQLKNSGLGIVHREELVRLAGLEKCRQSPNLSLSGTASRWPLQKTSVRYWSRRTANLRRYAG